MADRRDGALGPGRVRPGPAHFTFGKDGLGNFRFIAVDGQMDCRFSEKDGKPRVDFTWDGNDECGPASGRGWAVLDAGMITGRIYFHGGDDSAFTAQCGKADESTGKPRRKR